MCGSMDSSNVRHFVHIGLIKTGTTYLQARIFPHLNNVRLINPNQNLVSRQLLTKETRFLISDEGISGCPYWSDRRDLRYPEQFALGVSRLKQILPNARVICCFREPAAFLQSAYKQYLHEGGTLQFENFFQSTGDGVVTKCDLMFSRFID